jgi:major vault protein
MRSLISTEVRKMKVRNFYSNSLEVIRSIALGETGEKVFSENGMVIYDVDLLDVSIVNEEINDALKSIPQDQLRLELELEKRQAESKVKIAIEELERNLRQAVSKTTILRYTLTGQERDLEVDLETRNDDLRHSRDFKRATSDKELLEKRLSMDELKAEIRYKTDELSLDLDKVRAGIRSDQVKSEADACVKMLRSIQPQLIAILEVMANSGQLQSLAQYLAPLAIVQDKSIIGTARKLLEGTPLEKMLSNLEDISVT